MAKKSRETIVRMLVEDHGFSTDELEDMSYSELNETLKASESMSEALDEAVVEVVDKDEVPFEVTEEEEEIPLVPSDPEWSDWVLSKFQKNELVDEKHPTTDGLRRVAELVFGPFGSETMVPQVPAQSNNGRATVIVKIVFHNCPERNCQGAADVFTGNTDLTYAVHAVATAETRAEGRALRRALRLTGVISAEEASDAQAVETSLEGNIPNDMVTTLKMMADRVGLDPLKVAITCGYNIESLEELKHSEGLKVADQIGKYHREEIEITDRVRKN